MKKIYVVGDSISIQYGPYLEQYLRNTCEYGRKEGHEEAMENLDYPQGANGGDSSMVLAFLKSQVEAGWVDADFLLLNCGLHDIKTDPQSKAIQVPIEEYRQNLQAIIDMVGGMKPELVWIRTTPCDEKVHNARADMEFHRFAADCDAYNNAADEVMAKNGIASIDLHGFTMNLGENLYCDHVHYPPEVQQLQGAFIAGWVNCRVGG